LKPLLKTCYPWRDNLNPITETTFHVRYAETDKMGIVHHAAYVVWLEEGRSHWLRANGSSYANFEADGVALAVSDLRVRYIQAARYDQLVTARCWVEEVKSRKMIFGYQILDAATGQLLAEAQTHHICVDRAGQVTKIPDSWRTFLSQGLKPAP